MITLLLPQVRLPECVAQPKLHAARVLCEDTGDTRYKDESHLWVSKHLAGRTDNLICAMLVLEDTVVVKTVMHAFTLED